MWRKMIIDGIRQDPDWKNAITAANLARHCKSLADILLIAGSAPYTCRRTCRHAMPPTSSWKAPMKRITAGLDANDFLYTVGASRNYIRRPGSMPSKRR